MTGTAPPRALSTPELVAMVASLSALNALAIDIMLPALPQIGAAFELANDNDRQLVVVCYVALFGVAQLVYGPLADAFGRRSVLTCPRSTKPFPCSSNACATPVK